MAASRRTADDIWPDPATHNADLMRAAARLLDSHRWDIQTHYEGCWKRHPACCAVALRDALGGAT